MTFRIQMPHSMLRLSRYQLFFLFTLSCIGIALSSFSFVWVRDLEQSKFSAEFKREAENRIFTLQRDINTKIQEIISLEAFFNASEYVERSEFRTFTQSLLKHETGIQALEWIPYVKDVERQFYEESARKDGFSDFQITERERQGIMVRAATRDAYFPVYYIEPLEGNEMALGFDLASNPLRFETLKSSRDTAKMKTTPKITLVQETGKQSAFLVFQPIYNKKMPTGTVEARRKNLKGFVLGVLRIEDMVKDALSVIAAGGVDLYVYDAGETHTANRFLCFHASRTRPEPYLPIKDEATIKQGFNYSLPVTVADRTWQVYAVPAPDFFAAHENWQIWGIPFIVFTFTMFCIGSLFFILDRAEESKQHAKVLSQTVDNLELEINERNRVEKALMTEKENLREALAEIKTLRGIIPICSYCKKVRDDKGLWKQLEAYLHSHSEAQFSHGACPECHKKLIQEIRNKR